MAIRILTQNGVDNTNIDGARENNFVMSYRSGIIKSVMNEGRLYPSATNALTLDTCELQIYGHRIVIDEAVTRTFTTAPTQETKYALVGRVTVTDTVPSFSLIVQLASVVLQTNNINNANGVYEVQIGTFIHYPAGYIGNVTRTIDVISGAIKKYYRHHISIDNSYGCSIWFINSNPSAYSFDDLVTLGALSFVGVISASNGLNEPGGIATAILNPAYTTDGIEYQVQGAYSTEISSSGYFNYYGGDTVVEV